MKEKKKNSKLTLVVRLFALLITMVLMLGAVALVAYRDELNLDALKRWITYRNLETSVTGEVAPFTHAGGDDMDFALLDTGIVLSSQSGAHYYPFTGTAYAQHVEVMDSPVLSASTTAAVVYDAGGQSLHVFKNRIEAFSLTLTGQSDLLSARVNDSGWLAVTAQEEGYRGTATLYNDSYNEVIGVKLSSTFVVDAAISPDCKTLAVITIDQTGGVFESTLLLYPTDSDTPSAELSLGNTLVLDMDFESDTIWMLGESQLLCVSADGSGFTAYPFGQSYLKGCSFSGDGFAGLLMGSYATGPANQLVTVSADGTTLASKSLQGQALSMDAKGNYISLLTSDGLTVYAPDLTPYATLSDTQNASVIAQSADGSLLLADDQEAWLYLPVTS